MSAHDMIDLPPPAGYYYEWDGAYGKRKFTTAPHNGRECDRAVAYYTEEQVRAAIEADRQRRGEPVEGEEIMVNTPYDVFTLPLQPSGLSSGPRFVVHVPGPEQQPAPDVAALVEALERIASWPDGGNLSGQPHIKMFAAKTLAAYRKQGDEP